jgi:hypothetical protein
VSDVSDAGPPPDDERTAFLQTLAALLRVHPLVASVDERGEHFALAIRPATGERQIVFLENYFRESSDLPPGERETQVLGRIASLMRPAPPSSTWADARDRVLPVLRAPGFFRFPPGVREDASAVAAQPFLPHLDLALVLDEEDRMSYVTADDLTRWDLDLAAALVHAIRNAARLAPPVAHEEAPLFLVDADDTYESSRLALPGLLASFNGRVPGRPIAIIPTRSWCWIAGDADPAMIASLAEIADREYGESNRALSPALYTVDSSGEVIPLELPADHPAHAAVRTGHVKLALTEYASQKASLDARHEHDDLDVFVATLSGLRRDDGLPVTWAVWGSEVESLLPVADLVRFHGGAADHGFFVPFHRVVAILGAGFRPAPGHRPVRYHVHDHPPPHRIAELRAAETTIDEFVPARTP